VSDKEKNPMTHEKDRVLHHQENVTGGDTTIVYCDICECDPCDCEDIYGSSSR
jgi:hypothetical protein